MVERLKKEGTVLTEHVGDPGLKESFDDERIYLQDTAWLREADVLVAECTCPSLGVGYELAYAEAHGVPCWIFYDRSRTHLSAMLTGDPYFRIFAYADEAELMQKLETVLLSMKGIQTDKGAAGSSCRKQGSLSADGHGADRDE